MLFTDQELLEIERQATPEVARAVLNLLVGGGGIEEGPQAEIAQQHPLGIQNARERSKLRRAWQTVRKEIYLFLCTEDKKYVMERNRVRKAETTLVAVFSGFLVDKLGLSLGLATSLAALALLIPARITKNAWCSMVKLDLEQTEDPTEIRVLQELANRH